MTTLSSRDNLRSPPSSSSSDSFCSALSMSSDKLSDTLGGLQNGTTHSVSKDEGCPPDVINSPEIKCKNHERFFFKDGNVIFQVKDVLYKVHRYFFERDSTWFADRFARVKLNSGSENLLPHGWKRLDLPGDTVLFVNDVLKCTSLSSPGQDVPVIPLDDVTSAEFDALLNVFYPCNFLHGDLRKPAEWISVLKLSTMWGFASVREHAIDQICCESAIDRLILAHRYNIPSWRLGALADLCCRREPLELHEMCEMKVEDIAIVTKIWKLNPPPLQDDLENFRAKLDIMWAIEKILKSAKLETIAQDADAGKNSV